MNERKKSISVDSHIPLLKHFPFDIVLSSIDGVKLCQSVCSDVKAFRSHCQIGVNFSSHITISISVIARLSQNEKIQITDFCS